MIKIRTGENSPEAVAAKFNAAAKSVSGDGLAALITEGVGQLVRFASANVEVRTGRTKNSIYGKVTSNKGGVRGIVGATSSYHGFVREAGHGQQFLRYAGNKEMPRVLDFIGKGVISEIKWIFDG